MRVSADMKPVDATAGRAISGGERFVSTKHVANPHWEVCPQTRKNRTGVELAGIKFGRFAVVGLYDVPPSGLAAKWIVRCACGDFETRSAKAIRNPENWGDRCAKCREICEKRRRREWEQSGRDVDWRSL